MLKSRLRKLLPKRNVLQEAGQPLLGYNRYLIGPARGNALLSYLPGPARDELSGHPENEFSNRGIARTLPRALNELGYNLDIVSWDDEMFSTSKRYDLLIQHGGVNYGHFAPLVKLGGKTIYFSSGSYWKYHNAAEKRRFAAFTKRHGVRPPYDRLITYSEEEANRKADGIVAVGNEAVLETYAKFPRVYNLNLACYPDNRPDTISKQHSKTKNNFLFMAGGGNIHKGLDLTIEAFRELEQHLYIMAYMEPEILKVYALDLKCPNIHFIGPADFRSPEFYQAMDTCSFAILPSCSEGQPGSMVECLNEGLIPIITPDVHLDVGNFGFLLRPATIPKIRQIVSLAAKLPPDEVAQRSEQARQAALTKHSLELFLKQLKSHIKIISLPGS